MSTPGSVRIVAPLAGIDPAAADGDGLVYDGATGTWVRDPNTKVALADVQERVDALEAEAGGALKAFVQTARTGVTFGPCRTNGPWLVCPTEYRVTVPAAVGDLVQWLPTVMVDVSADSEHDLAAVISGAPVRYASTGTATQHPNGMARMYLGSGAYARSWPVITWQVQSGDLDTDGNLTLAVMYRSAAPGNTVGSAAYANSTITALNWGVVTAPGDDLTGRVTALEDALGAAGGIATLDGSSHVPIAQLPLGATSSTVAVGNDARLSDARTPTAHAASHASGGSDPVSPASIGALATTARGAAGGVASLDGSTLVPVAQLPVGTAAGTIAAGNDGRFTDARTPTAHAASHASGGSDPVTPVAIGALATTARGAASGVASLDGTTHVPIGELPLGTTSSTVTVGNDSRLSDSRTPTAHATSHASGGSDPVTPAAIGALATTARGAVNGVASLDGSTLVPIAQLPLGTSSSTVTVGNDSRLSNSRTPTAHATSHASGGSDPVTPAAIGAVATTAVGAASGVASLDSGTKVPLAQIPTGVELTANKNAASGYAGLDSSSKLTGSQQVYSSTIANVGNANAAGSANTAARGDHVHRGDLTVHLVQREDDAILGTSASTTKVTLHTVAMTGLLVNTIYHVQVKCPAYSSVAGDFVRMGLYKTSTATTALDQSTNEQIFVASGDVHNMTMSYFYKTGAAETAVTFVVGGWREVGTGTVTFRAWLGMPYQFRVTQMGIANLNSF